MVRIVWCQDFVNISHQKFVFNFEMAFNFENTDFSGALSDVFVRIERRLSGVEVGHSTESDKRS